MERVIGLENVVRDESSIVTVGTFDGVHIGHRVILDYLVDRAKKRQGTSVVVTFDPHPREVIYNETVPLLTTIQERAEVISLIGIDRLIVISFTPQFSRLSAESFVEDVLVSRIGLREIVVGYDHAFGKARSGDRQVLYEQGKRYGFDVDVIPATLVDQTVVSSTVIRNLIKNEGDVTTASQMLGRYYGLQGTVVRGAARGRGIGFPTANIVLDHTHKLIPKEGVYAVRTRIESGDTLLGGMMNIGRRPTFDDEGVHLEVHLFDFSGDLYDRIISVEFIRRLRDEQKFNSVEELKKQLYIDRKRCKEVLNDLV